MYDRHDKRVIDCEFSKIAKDNVKQNSDRAGYLIYQSDKKLNIN